MSRSVRRVVGVAMAAAVAAGGVSISRADPIVATDFVSTGDRINMNGTQTGLTTNLPGGNWIWGGGWNWGSPYLFATWDTNSQNIVSLSEEHTGLGLSVSSSGSYTKPTSLQISANLDATSDSGPHNGGGLGFWSVMPDQPTSSLVDAKAHFTGLDLVLLDSNDNYGLQVVEDGTSVGPQVAVGQLTADSGGVHNFYQLSYSVDTSTGSISDVTFNGSAVSGLSSAAFSDAATAYAGVMSDGGARIFMSDFAVSTAAVPEPASLALLALGAAACLRRRRA